jgi:hypothetical protein
LAKLGSEEDKQVTERYRRAGWRLASAGTRSPVIAPVTRVLLGLPLIVAPTQTDDWFAWTIAVPLTAVWLGACYWSGTLLALLASRRPLWAQTRVSVIVAVVFAPLVTAATFIHLDEFHTDQVIGILWIAAYAVYMPLLGWVVYRQLQEPGGDPPRDRPLALWVRALLGVQAVVLVPLAIAMFVLPGEFSPGDATALWPWPLTELTSQVLGAWTLAFGVFSATLLWENDQNRVAPYLLAYPVLGGLGGLAIARYPDPMQWDELSAFVFVGYLASTLLLGAYGYLVARKAPEPEPG